MMEQIPGLVNFSMKGACIPTKNCKKVRFILYGHIFMTILPNNDPGWKDRQEHSTTPPLARKAPIKVFKEHVLEHEFVHYNGAISTFNEALNVSVFEREYDNKEDAETACSCGADIISGLEKKWGSLGGDFDIEDRIEMHDRFPTVESLKFDHGAKFNEVLNDVLKKRPDCLKLWNKIS